ncbi:MAG: Hsp20/alpha crystallin family protein [Pedosphaera sp.]|nr:Hsp20/alpha crystallin family protein [Pedosphaera sp.]
MKLIQFQRPQLWSTPFERAFTLRDEINRVFGVPSGGCASDESFTNWTPALDLFDLKEKFEVRVELPGLNKDDIQIALHENTLTIKGERRAEPQEGEETISRSERLFGRFERSIELPTAADLSKVEARYTDGILTVTLAKSEAVKPTKINITVN